MLFMSLMSFAYSVFLGHVLHVAECAFNATDLKIQTLMNFVTIYS